MALPAGRLDSIRASPGMKAEVVAFVGDDVDMGSLGQMLDPHSGHSRPMVSPGGVAAAIAALPSMSAPRVLLVDLSGLTSPLDEIDRLADVCDPDTQVVAIGDHNDVRLYRELIDIGLADYLVKPLDQGLIDRTFQALADRARAPVEAAQPKQAKAGRLIIVIGARGGVGATTVVINLGWQLAQEHRRRTAIVDLDLRFGNAALNLDIEPGAGLIDALVSSDRIDGLLTTSAASRVTERLVVYGAEAPLDGAINVDAGAVELLVQEIRDASEYVIIDLPRSAAVTSDALIQNADEVIIVTDMSLAGLRDTVRLNQMVQSIASATKVLVVANRMPKGGKTHVPRSEFERMLGTEIAYSLPEDTKTVLEATTAGKPVSVVAKAEAISKALQDLAVDRLNPEHQVAKKGGWMSNLSLSGLLSGSKKA